MIKYKSWEDIEKEIKQYIEDLETKITNLEEKKKSLKVVPISLQKELDEAFLVQSKIRWATNIAIEGIEKVKREEEYNKRKKMFDMLKAGNQVL